MEVLVTYDPSSGVRIQTVCGEVTPEALSDYLVRLYAPADFVPGEKVLWDFREADLCRFRLPDVVDIRDLIETGLEKIKPAQAALVVSNPMDHNLTTMFEMLIRSPETAARVFFDYEDAMRWLERGWPI